MSSTDETETPTRTFWTPGEDQDTLCDECGLQEMNTSMSVVFGLVEPYESMEQVADRFENEFQLPGYFQHSEHGTCAKCGATA